MKKYDDYRDKNEYPEVTKKILELMTLAVLVHEKSDYCVFISYSGHINKCEIRICKNIETYNKVIAESTLHVGGDSKYDTTDGMIEVIDNACNSLKDILEHGKLQYENLDYYTETIKHYYLH